MKCSYNCTALSLAPIQGSVQQLYSVQCDGTATISAETLASIQCLNVPQGGAGCDQFQSVSLARALARAGVSERVDL